VLTPLPSPFGLIATLVVAAAIIALASLGGVLVASGWRGRLIGWAPTCAACGFDLRASVAEMPIQCPECGRRLAGSIDAGPRRAQAGRVVIGLLFLVVTTVIGLGMPLGLLRTMNNWVLSQRPIESFSRALDAGDQRAWRLALDRIRIGTPSTSDIEALLERILRNGQAAGSLTINERSALVTMSRSAAAPTGMCTRVLDLMATLPSSVRLTSVAERRSSTGPLAINASLDGWPQLAGVDLRIRVLEVIGADGASLPRLLTASVNDDFTARPRSLMNTAIVRAPPDEGAVDLRVRVEVVAMPDASLSATASPSEPLWQRVLEIPLVLPPQAATEP